MRDPEYLNLLARMTAFAVLLTAMIQDPVWSLLLSALVMYLTVWQLLPLGQKYDQNSCTGSTRLPKKSGGRKSAGSWPGLAFADGLIIIFWLAIMPGQFAWSLLLLVWCGLLAKGYLPYKTQQLAKKSQATRSRKK